MAEFSIKNSLRQEYKLNWPKRRFDKKYPRMESSGLHPAFIELSQISLLRGEITTVGLGSYLEVAFLKLASGIIERAVVES